MAWRNYDTIESALKDKDFGKWDFTVKNRKDVKAKDNAIFIKGMDNVIVFGRKDIRKRLNKMMNDFVKEQNKAFKEGKGWLDVEEEDHYPIGGEQETC